MAVGGAPPGIPARKRHRIGTAVEQPERTVEDAWFAALEEIRNALWGDPPG